MQSIVLLQVVNCTAAIATLLQVNRRRAIKARSAAFIVIVIALLFYYEVEV